MYRIVVGILLVPGILAQQCFDLGELPQLLISFKSDLTHETFLGQCKESILLGAATSKI